jgi:hypothetical protein
MSVASRPKKVERGVTGIETNENRDVLSLNHPKAKCGESSGNRVGGLKKKVTRHDIDDVAG